jgi:hypothetical protein
MSNVNQKASVIGLAAVLAGGLALLSTGCGGPEYEGDPRAAVSGTVTFDGTPVVHGTVNFVPTGEGRPASGGIADGKYLITEERGPNLGTYKVEILGYASADAGSEAEDDEDMAGEGGDEEDEVEGQPTGPSGQIIPAKYNTQTTLEVEITAGDNEHNFTLTTE